MKKLIMRLKSKAGESLIESMTAILIFTFASIAMYTMISAANDINLRAKEADQKHMEQMVIAEMAEGSAGTGTVSFSVNEGTAFTVDVDVYRGTDGSLYAYYPKVVTP